MNLFPLVFPSFMLLTELLLETQGDGPLCCTHRPAEHAVVCHYAPFIPTEQIMKGPYRYLRILAVFPTIYKYFPNKIPCPRTKLFLSAVALHYKTIISQNLTVFDSWLKYITLNGVHSLFDCLSQPFVVFWDQQLLVRSERCKNPI